MKVFLATEFVFDELKWQFYDDVLTARLKTLGVKVLDCAADYALLVRPVLVRFPEDFRNAVYPAVKQLVEALCSQTIQSCDRILVVMEGADDDGAVVSQVRDASRQGKPMDGYWSPSHRKPGDSVEPSAREIEELIVRSGGSIASSLDELTLIYSPLPRVLDDQRSRGRVVQSDRQRAGG